MVLLITGLAAVIAVMLVVYAFDPISGAFPYPRCIFKVLTGLDCPGCGSTRALHALLHGRISEAADANPAVFVAVPLAALCCAAESPKMERLRRVLFSPVAIAAIIAATLLWTIFRNTSWHA